MPSLEYNWQLPQKMHFKEKEREEDYKETYEPIIMHRLWSCFEQIIRNDGRQAW
jgi:transposase